MGFRSPITDADFYRNLLKVGWKMQSVSVTLAADNYQITTEHPPVIKIDPAAAARDVLLPPVADSKDLMFVLFNTSDNATGAETITLKTSADAALVPAVTILKTDGAIVHCDGVEWRAISGA